jgi:peptidyl-prolyl cis-trans isomerase A (cyclophilin A)
MRSRFVLSLGAAALVLSGCCKADSNASATPPSPGSTAVASENGPGSPASREALHDPSKATEKAPELYKAKFATTKGDFVIEVHRDWSPNAADRFYNLVRIGFYDGIRFFRVVDGFMAQFGIHGDPGVMAKWRSSRIPDDPPKQSNKRGFVSFAMAGPGSRTTQVFINYVDGNARLDPMGFAPFGQVVSGMDVVDSLYKGYGEAAPKGKGPDQTRMQTEGNAYLEKEFPQLDSVKTATIVP